jgi:16S rRNA processing protein RimM
LKEVYLFGDGSRYQVESAWFHGERLILKFAGIDSISDAEPLQGAEVRIPLRERAALEPGEFFHSDLIGCEVIERATGQSLGQVTAWEDCGGSGLLVVRGDLLIPFAASICVDIDTQARRIVVDLPEGLKELNRV